ncbi:Probable RNA-directed DNA polymerase from transposon BS [Eumeta japonica]|uniref:Probable RNA-directed DNA polymerase from transposon BS n=1 Tax=Eumeta variegata TaxID=151549 RepID=A0A4C1XNV2_EUMVA|nr:Probable RNA-directed DNA polymerase from transposon BS [Eumeta japonica]
MSLRQLMSNAPGCSTPPPPYPLIGRHKPKNITLLSFNARGLHNNIVKLNQCTKKYGIDVALVQETLLTPNRPKSCALAGYLQLQTDRTDAPLGGTAVFYKLLLQCCPIDLPNLSNIEATWGCRHLLWRFNPGDNKLPRLSKKLKLDIIALLIPTHYPDDLVSRLSITDIAITKGVALNVNCIEPIHRFVSDHRPVLLRMGPPTGGCLKPMIRIIEWKRVSAVLEEVDTPALNNIPDIIETTHKIDSALGALTNHIRTLVKRCSRVVPASVDRRKLPTDALELLTAKNAALRHSHAYPSRENRSRARALQRRVRARMMEVKNEEWNNLMEEITPTHQAFWKVTRALKSEGYLPTIPLKKPDSSLAIDDQEKAEYIADSTDAVTFYHHTRANTSLIEDEVRHKTSLEPRDDHSPVFLDEFIKLVMNLKAKKAPGFDGISNKGKMEVDAIKEMFSTSEEKFRVKYGNCIGDGDSKTFKAILDLEPYGKELPVVKSESIGHVEKRMDSRFDI